MSLTGEELTFNMIITPVLRLYNVQCHPAKVHLNSNESAICGSGSAVLAYIIMSFSHCHTNQVEIRLYIVGADANSRSPVLSSTQKLVCVYSY
jgi:hypothetical protein